MKLVALSVGLIGFSAVLAMSCGSSSSSRNLRAEGGAGGETPNVGGGRGDVPGSAGEAAGGSGNVVLGAAGVGGDAPGVGGETGAGGQGGSAPGGAAGQGGSAAGETGAGGQGGAATSLIVFNTGVDDAGVALPGGSVDPHYTLIESAESSLPGPDAIVTSEIAAGYWVPQSDTSKWIAPSANQSYPGATPCNATGTYVYRTTFTLTAEQVATFKLDGQWGADNSGADITLNDVSLGITAASYAPLTAFTITSGFVTGTNTLDFEILDVGCPNGLRVELTATQVD